MHACIVSESVVGRKEMYFGWWRCSTRVLVAERAAAPRRVELLQAVVVEVPHLLHAAHLSLAEHLLVPQARMWGTGGGQLMLGFRRHGKQGGAGHGVEQGSLLCACACYLATLVPANGPREGERWTEARSDAQELQSGQRKATRGGCEGREGLTRRARRSCRTSGCTRRSATGTSPRGSCPCRGHTRPCSGRCS